MEYAEDEPVYGGRPGLATTVAAVLLIGSCASELGRPGAGPTGGTGATLGYIVGGALLGALVWGICYAITIKRASPPWQIASLLTLTVLGLLTSLAKVVTPAAAAQTDAKEAARALTEVMHTGEPATLRPDASPLSRLMVKGVNQQLATAKGYTAASQAAGLDKIVSFEGLTKTTPALDRCDRVAALAQRAAASGDAVATGIADLRREGEALVAQGQLSRTALDGFIDGATRSSARTEAQWALNERIATDGGALCRILARRNWQLGADGTVLFTSDADLAATQPILARIGAAMAEMERHREAARQAATNTAERLRGGAAR